MPRNRLWILSFQNSSFLDYSAVISAPFEIEERICIRFSCQVKNVISPPFQKQPPPPPVESSPPGGFLFSIFSLIFCRMGSKKFLGRIWDTSDVSADFFSSLCVSGQNMGWSKKFPAKKRHSLVKMTNFKVPLRKLG